METYPLVATSHDDGSWGATIYRQLDQGSAASASIATRKGRGSRVLKEKGVVVRRRKGEWEIKKTKEDDEGA